MKHALLGAALCCGLALGLVTSCGPEVEVHLDRAGALLEAGQAAEAVADLEALDPRLHTDARVARMLAKAYAAAERFDDADRALRAAADRHPDDPDLAAARTDLETAVMRAAVERKKAGKTLEARQLIDGLRDREPAPDAAFLARVSAAYRAIDELAPAEALLRGAVEEHPADAMLVEELVAVYSQLGLYDKAADILVKAREAGLGDDHVALSLGVCRGRLGDLKAAQEEFDRAAAAGADRPQLDYNLALLLEASGKPAEALAKLEGLIDGPEPLVVAQREAARLMLELHPDDKDTIDKALLLAWSVTDAEPKDWRAYEVIGDAFFKLEDYPAAKGAYTTALQNCPANVRRLEDKFRTNETALLAMEAAERGETADH